MIRRKHESQIERWQGQIKNFYWPLYLALIENQQIWKYAIEQKLMESATHKDSQDICNADETESESESESENSSSIPEIPILRMNPDYCAHFYDNNTQCGVRLSVNQKRIFGPYCMAHFGMKQKELMSANSIRITEYNHTTSNVTNTIVMVPSQSQMNIQDICEQIHRQFDANHTRIYLILTNYLPLIHSRTKLGKYIVQFQQYISAFRLLNKDRSKPIINPRKQNASYPKRILPYIEEKLFETQSMLNVRINDFYKELDTHSTSNRNMNDEEQTNDSWLNCNIFSCFRCGDCSCDSLCGSNRRRVLPVTSTRSISTRSQG